MTRDRSAARYVGLDVHKSVVVACIIDESGRVLLRDRFACAREALENFAVRHLRPSDKVVLEATTNTWEVVNVMRPSVAEVVVSNPARTKAIAEAKVKTDKVDAFVLAQLLRCDFLPRVWEPPPDIQSLRRLTARRAGHVMDKTAVKNRIHAVLHQRLIHSPFKDLFCKQGRAWLAGVSLDDEGRAAIDSDLRLLASLEEEIAREDRGLAEHGHSDERVKLLMTLPGVDLIVAETLLAALGDVHRFKTGDAAASYLGLVPSTRQSAGSCYHGPITKHGSGHARAMLVQAVQHVGAHPGPLGAFFRRLAKRKNHNVAVIATARKLVVVAWHMLKNNESYRYAQPATLKAKLDRLRVEGGGEQKRRGPRKGSPRPTSYGTGQRTYLVPSLREVLVEANLPPAKTLDELPAGEQRTVRQAKAASFVRTIQKARKVRRTAAKPSKVQRA